MIQFTQGDLFESEAQTLTNAVNCIGVMGAGIAYAFRERYPAMYEDYNQRCAEGKVRKGQPYLYLNPEPPHVLNFPTMHWPGERADLATIRQGLADLREQAESLGITSIAIPALGCGVGRLAWEDVKDTTLASLNGIEIPVWVYEPHDSR